MSIYNIYQNTDSCIFTDIPEISKVVYTKEHIRLYVPNELYFKMCQLSMMYLREKKTREAFVKTYFFLAYVYTQGKCDLSEKFLEYQMEIGHNTMVKILDYLKRLCLINVYSSKRIKSIIKDKNYNVSYSYSILPIDASFKRINYNSNTEFSVHNTMLNFKRISKITLHKIFNEEFKSNAKSKSSPRVLSFSHGGCYHSIYCLNSLPNLLKDFELNRKNSFDEVYFAPYEELELVVPVNYRFIDYAYDSYKIWNVHHTESAYLTECGRLQHSFHQLKRDMRQFVYYKNSRLVEAYDLHNCFFVLLCFLLKNNISDAEYIKYRDLVSSGLFYEDICKSPDFIDFYKQFPNEQRQAIKIQLQQFRNLTLIQMEKFGTDRFKGLIKYFQREFPEILDFLDNYPRYDGHKLLQRDMCMIETIVFSQICNELLKYDVTPFTLHDGIYMSENDMRKLNQNYLESIIDKFVFNKL